MSRRRLFLPTIGVALIAAACGGGGNTTAPSTPPAPAPTAAAPTTAAPAACRPSGGQLELTAKGIQYDKDCLAVTANQAFTIRFNNKSPGIPHNVAIKSLDLFTGYFSGEVIKGVKSIEYHVKALPAGTYRFRCDVHPSDMKGTLVVA